MVEFFEKKGITKAYVSKVKNSSDDRKVNEKKVKESFEKALAARKSHAFEIVTKEAAADIIVEVDVIAYFWTEEDPVDIVFPAPAVAIDAASKENYARMGANIVVRDAKNGRKLWSEKIRSSLTNDKMTKKESYGLVSERLAKDFIKRLFRKPRGKR